MLSRLMGFYNIEKKVKRSSREITYKGSSNNSKNKIATPTNYKLALLVVLVYIVVNIINIIEINQILHRIRNENINYDLFREMNISDEEIEDLIGSKENYINNTFSKPTDIEASPTESGQYDEYDILTLYMLIYNYSTFGIKKMNKCNVDLFLKSLIYDKSFIQLRDYYFNIFNDIESFPVVKSKEDESNISFENTWNAPRSYGGDRSHEGTDLMARDNVRGKHKIVSMTKGIVEQKGWLEQGGYRIGIRSEGGSYFYYAHLDSYADDIEVGDPVEAGQFLGYMGDSGYGPEGTIGQFDVHLHLGIYIEAHSGELSINPYYILKYLQTTGEAEMLSRAKY